MGETVGNALPNQICYIPVSAPNDPAAPKLKGLTLLVPPQAIYQREHAARIRESSLRQSNAVKDKSDTIVQVEDRVWFSSLSGDLDRDVRIIEHAICSRG